MDLVTLDDSYQPKEIFENYDSIVWSERYSKYGDFQIISSDISTAVKALPLRNPLDPLSRETCVSLLDSNVPMVVETHKLVKELRDKPRVEITGRSFETVIERRGSVKDLPASYTTHATWLIPAAKPSDAAYLAMRRVLGDEARYQSGNLVLPLINPAVSPNDAIPEISLTLPLDYQDMLNATVWSSATTYFADSLVMSIGYVWKALITNLNVAPSSSVPTTWQRLWAFDNYEIKPGNLYSTVVDLINTNHRGIKAVRPAPGEVKVGIEIYNGADITQLVSFDARFEQIDSATYLLSEQGSADVAYMYGANGSQQVLKTAAAEPSGLERRVLVSDQTGDTTALVGDVLKTRGLIELYKYNDTALFDGQVAEQVAAGYNRDYFLGDILKLIGEFGLEQNVRVVEFIRSSDSSGSKAYPTFEAVDD